MPLVVIRHEPALKNKCDLTNVAISIREIIASELSCKDKASEGMLTPDDLEVMLIPFGPCDTGSQRFGLQVFVDANDYPSRRNNLRERTDRIAKAISFLDWGDTLHCFVWIRLMPAAFLEFETYGLRRPPSEETFRYYRPQTPKPRRKPLARRKRAKR